MKAHVYILGCHHFGNLIFNTFKSVKFCSLAWSWFLERAETDWKPNEIDTWLSNINCGKTIAEKRRNPSWGVHISYCSNLFYKEVFIKKSGFLIPISPPCRVKMSRPCLSELYLTLLTDLFPGILPLPLVVWTTGPFLVLTLILPTLYLCSCFFFSCEIAFPP